MGVDGTGKTSAMDFSTGPRPNCPGTQFNNIVILISTISYKPYFNTLNWLKNRPNLNDYGILLKCLIVLGELIPPRSLP